MRKDSISMGKTAAGIYRKIMKGHTKTRNTFWVLVGCYVEDEKCSMLTK